jgi:peptidoglycan hydrolase-like protein with peptidoglycan-binding domain
MNHNKILRIIHEEVNHQEGLLFEGMTYNRGMGYRNNQLLEIYDNNGNLLLTEGVIDDVQSVLDYAGFIPGIGDFLDAINAIIYFFRKKWILGGLSFVAVIPIVGSLIATPFKALHKLIGNTLTKIFSKMTTNGKGAAKGLLDLLSTGSSKVKGLIKKIYGFIEQYMTSINHFLDTLIPKFAKMVSSASFGFVALPSSFIKSGNVIIKQLKDFFAGVAKGSSYKTTKAITKKEVKDEIKAELDRLSDTEKAAYAKTYAKKEVDKKKYPTFNDFLVAQMKLKVNTNKISLTSKDIANALTQKGKEMTDKATKAVATWMKTSGNEIKLWSKYVPLVKLVQKAVGVKPDGTFGTATENAVKIAQKKVGLTPDGVVGPKTWAQIT